MQVELRQLVAAPSASWRIHGKSKVMAPARTVRDLLASGERSYSFEFMPPRSDAAEQTLWHAIRDLEGLRPSFVSVTYGAGGATRERTVRTTARMAAETTLLPVGHLTAVAHTVSQLRHVIGQYADAGVTNLLALRGDPPGDPGAEWMRCEGGLGHADELVSLVRDCGRFCVGVAAFPEVHPRSPDRETDITYFIQKVRAGADFAVTQMFFRVDDYLRFRDAVDGAGCSVPIIPGIMPVTAVSQIDRFAALCGSPLPPGLQERVRAAATEPAAVRAVGVAYAVKMCERLMAEGVRGLHFYTLNRSLATREIYAALGLTPRPTTPARSGTYDLRR